jgi:hypothetical protein
MQNMTRIPRFFFTETKVFYTRRMLFVFLSLFPGRCYIVITFEIVAELHILITKNMVL